MGKPWRPHVCCYPLTWGPQGETAPERSFASQEQQLGTGQQRVAEGRGSQRGGQEGLQRLPPSAPLHQQQPWRHLAGCEHVGAFLQCCWALLSPPRSPAFLCTSLLSKGTATAEAHTCNLGCPGSHPTGRNNIRDTPSCFRFYFRIYKIPVSSILMSLFTCLHIVSKFQS